MSSAPSAALGMWSNRLQSIPYNNQHHSKKLQDKPLYCTCLHGLENITSVWNWILKKRRVVNKCTYESIFSCVSDVCMYRMLLEIACSVLHDILCCFIIKTKLETRFLGIIWGRYVSTDAVSHMRISLKWWSLHTLCDSLPGKSSIFAELCEIPGLNGCAFALQETS